MQLNLRLVELTDLHFIWMLRNDPVTRENSFSSDPIDLDTHERWFIKRIASDSTRLYILEENEKPVGMIRFDKVSDVIAQVNLALVPEVRGLGYGKTLLGESLILANKELAVNQFDAFVKSTNEPSLRLFNRCGFHQIEEQNINGLSTFKLRAQLT